MRKGFTLIELLVVIGIIALLMGILLPVLSKARASANRTACRASLHDIGTMFTMYLNDSSNKLPHVNPLPSVSPPFDGVALVKVLSPYYKGATAVFECKADHIKDTTTGAPTGFTRYFDREGTSFEYDSRLSQLHAGRSFRDVLVWQEQSPEGSKGLDRIPVMYDFEPFHGKKDALGSRNVLYADMHVADQLE